MDKVLIPIERLANGSTIRQEYPSSVSYHHIELDGHALVRANGLAAETFLDTGNRNRFPISAGEGRRAANAQYCLPIYEGGFVVEAIRERMFARATTLGWRQEAADDGLLCIVDGIERKPLRHHDQILLSFASETRELALKSNIWIPQYAAASSLDRRRLGVKLLAMTIVSGTEIRQIDLRNLRVSTGLSHVETEGQAVFRWTNGEVRFDPALWAGMEGALMLQLQIAVPQYQVWFQRQENIATIA